MTPTPGMVVCRKRRRQVCPYSSLSLVRLPFPFHHGPLHLMSLAPGSQISVYGRIVPGVGGAQQPLSLYSVGSQKLQAFIPDDVTQATDNVAFFNSTVMPYGQYTIVVNVTRVDADAPYFFDYFRYNTSSPAAAGSSRSTSTPTTGTTTGTSSASGTQIGSSNASSSSSPPIGAIVGGVLGGVAVLAAAVFAFFCYRIRKRKSKIFLSPNGEKMCTSSIISHNVFPLCLL